MNADVDQRPSEPSVVGVRVRPAWSVGLYIALAVSAALALFARSGGLDPVIARMAPWAFLVFAVGFSVYRVALVAAGRYSPFRAFIQILLAALFFLLLLMPAAGQKQATATVLLGHTDSRVRALAAEVIGLRGDVGAARELVASLQDSSAEVQQAAHQALVRLNGEVDLGPAGDPNARAAWRARFP